ncbi:hypothetical protein GC173_06355 [bacterium]|nr:hypothetical protein [bacterium]
MPDQLRQALERYFAEFPPPVADAIHQELLKPNGLPGLLQRLGLQATGTPSDQYATLIRHLRRDGLRSMENLVGHSLTEPDSRETYEKSLDATRRLDVERTKLQSPGPDVKKYQVPSLPDQGGAKPAGGANARIALVTPPTKSATTPSAPAVAQTPQPDAPAFPSGPLKPGIPPEPGTFDAKTPSWDPSKPHDPAGKWPEVERRSGRERRKGPRRNEVEITYRNRRFGKDRRAETERRRNWPRGGHQS